MPAGAPQDGLFRFACVSIALTVLIVPGVALLGFWSPVNDRVLPDTYYATMRVQQIAMAASFALPHQIGAIICAMLAAKRSGAMAAGWVLSGSGLVLLGGQLLPILMASFVLPPKRYVDYAPAFDDLRWTADLAQYSALAALIGMAVGWLMLGLSSQRRVAAEVSDQSG